MTEARKANTVLIIGEDPVVTQLMADSLASDHLSADFVENHFKALAKYSQLNPDLIILNARAYKSNFTDAIRDLCTRGQAPIIVVGDRQTDVHRVRFLELGADDYLSKPFEMSELSARIRVHLRRTGSSPADSQRKAQTGKWIFGGWELRLKSRELRDPTGALVPLTKGEYTLLLAFIEAAERPLSREYLLQATRIHEDIFDRSIDVQILRLRRKLEENAHLPRLITTTRGVGYTFSIPTERA